MALIPPIYFNCVVAIGVKDEKGFLKWTGTGTLIGRLFGKLSSSENQYHVFIATNKHVLEGQRSVVVRFNPLAAEPAKDFDIPLLDKSGKRLWTDHPRKNLDVAVIALNSDVLVAERIRYHFFQSDQHLMPLAEMAERGVSEGDFVYVLGFPMGIVDMDRQYVIARSGVIARLRDALEGKSPDFLIDASVFPGNSGGPVVYKPEIISIEGTPSVTKPGLIGIVSSYLTYKDTAVSQQTGKPRVIFEENSGLAVVIPADYVLETMEACFATMNIKETRLTPTL